MYLWISLLMKTTTSPKLETLKYRTYWLWMQLLGWILALTLAGFSFYTTINGKIKCKYDAMWVFGCFFLHVPNLSIQVLVYAWIGDFFFFFLFFFFLLQDQIETCAFRKSDLRQHTRTGCGTVSVILVGWQDKTHMTVMTFDIFFPCSFYMSFKILYIWWKINEVVVFVWVSKIFGATQIAGIFICKTQTRVSYYLRNPCLVTFKAFVLLLFLKLTSGESLVNEMYQLYCFCPYVRISLNSLKWMRARSTDTRQPRDPQKATQLSFSL